MSICIHPQKILLSSRQNETLIKGNVSERSRSGFDSLFDPFALFLRVQFMPGIIVALNSNQLMRLSFSDIDFHRRAFFNALLSNFTRKTLKQTKLNYGKSQRFD